MTLPQLNAVPQYNMTLPSTGKEHRFRPFLVKEEKVLMIASESQDNKTIVQAIGDIVESCVEGVDKNTLSSIDIEYAFLKIRSKSVGETTDVSFTCKGCQAEVPVTINLDEIQAPKFDKNASKKVDLGNNIYINLRVPAYSKMADLDINDTSATNAVFGLITTCIESIITENEHIKAADVSYAELNTFLESMTNAQFKNIQNFVESLPRLSHTIKFTGPCGHKNEVTLEGVQSFF